MFWMQEDEIVRNVKAQQDTKAKEVPPSFVLRLATEKDAEALAQLFRHVFQVYPTPLDSPEYIQKNDAGRYDLLCVYSERSNC
ncbi:hypothetical protein GCM10020331_064080 [Ectobacillus funiculus]